MVAVGCPLSSHSCEFLQGQLREMRAVSQIICTEQHLPLLRTMSCLSEFQHLTRTFQDEQEVMEWMQRAVEGTAVTVVLVTEHTLWGITGDDIAVKTMVMQGRPVLAVVTAAGQWQQLQWQGRVEAIQASVFAALKEQLDQGIQETACALELRLKHEFSVHERIWKESFDKLNVALERVHLKQQMVYLTLCVKLTAILTALRTTSSASVPESDHITSPPLSPELPSEPLTEDWQQRIFELEQSLGEQLSPQAVSVLTRLPDAEKMTSSELVTALLRAL